MTDVPEGWVKGARRWLAQAASHEDDGSALWSLMAWGKRLIWEAVEPAPPPPGVGEGSHNAAESVTSASGHERRSAARSDSALTQGPTPAPSVSAVREEGRPESDAKTVGELIAEANAFARFYSERPCVDEQQHVPGMAEMSRRECLEVALSFRRLSAALSDGPKGHGNPPSDATSEPKPAIPDGLRELSERATAGPWELQDGSSWRRIGTRGQDGNVLCPYNARSDNHPDLTAGRGEDLYANLKLIVAAVNWLRQSLSGGETG